MILHFRSPNPILAQRCVALTVLGQLVVVPSSPNLHRYGQVALRQYLPHPFQPPFSALCCSTNTFNQEDTVSSISATGNISLSPGVSLFPRPLAGRTLITSNPLPLEKVAHNAVRCEGAWNARLPRMLIYLMACEGMVLGWYGLGLTLSSTDSDNSLPGRRE